MKRLFVVLVIFVAVATAYNVATPVYESYDETGHVAYVQILARRHHLPRPAEYPIDRDEYFQPPVYYLIAALPVALLGSYSYQPPVLNPYGMRGDGRAGYNMVVHTAAEDWPYHGLALAIHLARLVSTMLGALNLLLTFVLARTVTRDRAVALAAALLMALTPGFLFLSGVVNNDNGVAVFELLLLLIAARSLARQRVSLLAFSALGLVLGLAILSKITALGMIVFLAGFCAYASARFGRAWRNLAGLIVSYLIAALVVSPWLLYSLRHHQDIGVGANYQDAALAVVAALPRAAPYVPVLILAVPLAIALARWRHGGLAAILAVAALAIAPVIALLLRAVLADPAPLARLAWQADHIFRSYWGLFGWGILGLPRWAYALSGGIVALAGLGIGIRAARRAFSRQTLDWASVFLGFAFCVTVLVVINQWRDEVLSRYFLALTGPTSIVLALGLRELARRWWLRPLASGAIGVLGVVAMSTPFLVIQPAYALPPRYPDASAVTIPSPTDVVFARQIELLGYDLDATRIAPGSTIHLTLFYRALAPIRHDYPLTITLGSPLPRESKAVELLRTYPGRGMDQTSRWVPGQVIVDRYTLDIPPTVTDAHTWRLLVGFDGLPPGSREGGATAAATPLRLLAVDGVPPATVPPEVALASPVTFGDQIQLIGATTTGEDGRVQVRLWWKALAVPRANYTTFVHLTRDPGQAPVAVGDSPPLGGSFPTSDWRPGEVIADSYWLTPPLASPSGSYLITVGLYDAATGQRLPATMPPSGPLPVDAAIVGRVTLPPSSPPWP